MKLWDIKANALRLMFADSDIQFNENDFKSNDIYVNANTGEKLVRMNDSIRRAIDLYYQYCGQYARRKEVKFVVDGENNNELDLSSIMDFGEPSRIDLKKDIRNGIIGENNIPYYYDNISKKIYIDFENVYDLKCVGFDFEQCSFILFYITKKDNLPDNPSDLDFDLDSLGIPSDIQSVIPKYIKSEIYEEDEYAMAQYARSEYIQFLINSSNKYSNVQTKVKNYFPRG